MQQPIISIITVVYNGAALLEATIRSVLNQTYPGIEYIIVDGGSKDDTLFIIQKYELKISKWISEPDNGIYDAMSKGLKLATGDFVLYLNCGDHLFSTDTIEKVFNQYQPEADVYYGDSMLVNEKREHLGLLSAVTVHRLPEHLDWRSMKLGMNVCHQSFIARRTLAGPYMKNNLVADLDWVIRILKKSRLNINTHLVISEFLSGGISKQRHRQSLWDRYAILKHYFGFWPNLFHHIMILIRALKFKYLKRGKVQY